MISIINLFRGLFIALLISSCTTSKITPTVVSGERQPQSKNTSSEGVTIVGDTSRFLNVFVISDVHGMYKPLVKLLRAGQVIDKNNEWIAKDSLLIITGDSIDKGPDSLNVLSLWVNLQKQAIAAGGGLIHVLGNHEAEFLADPKNDKKAAELLTELKNNHLPITELTSTKTARGFFLHTEPVAAQVGVWLFCHSGFYPDMSWKDFTQKADKVVHEQNYDSKFLIADDSILEMKDWDKDKPTRKKLLDRLDNLGIYGVVFGHQPGAFGIEGRSAAKAKGRFIKIDNGMAPEAGSHEGSLLVFTSPAQMMQPTFPSIKIILPNGTSHDLNPE